MLEGRDLPSFSSPVVYPVNQPIALAAADVPGDSKPALISLAGSGRGVGICVNVQLNNGSGAFGPPQSFTFGPNMATAMAVSNGEIVLADKENDISLSTSSYLGSVEVLVGTGQGSFTYVGSSTIFQFEPIIDSLALANLYGGTGEQDLVAADTSGSLYVARGFGGTFGDAQPLASGGGLYVAVGDFNGDNKPDIVAAGNGYVTVLPNTGNGTFAAPQSYAVAGSPTAVAVGDFNRDGHLDIVTANANGTVSVLLNNGNGTFGAAQNYAVSGPANSVAVGDFNHDGFLDVATTGAELDVLMNNGNGTFGAYQKVGPAGSNVVAGDFVSAGFSDLAQIDGSRNSVDVVLNNADPTPLQVALSFGSITYNRKTNNLYSETVTLTNQTGGTLAGPLSLELMNLPGGVVLTDATGATSGNPYFRFLSSGKSLKPGASVSITLTFSAPYLSDLVFDTAVVAL
jgi:hypothetical protein